MDHALYEEDSHKHHGGSREKGKSNRQLHTDLNFESFIHSEVSFFLSQLLLDYFVYIIVRGWSVAFPSLFLLVFIFKQEPEKLVLLYWQSERVFVGL